jgi:hypothetical protein
MILVNRWRGNRDGHLSWHLALAVGVGSAVGVATARLRLVVLGHGGVRVGGMLWRNGAVVSVVLDGLGHVHLALWWRWVRGDGATRDADSGCGAAVAHKIDSTRRILVPQVNHENEKSAIDFVHIDLGTRGGVADKDADAGRGCDGTAVFVAETAHAGADWLLLDDEAVCTAIAHANVVAVVFAGLVCGCGGRLHLLLLLLLLLGRLRGKLNGLALLELLALLEGLALLDLLGRLLLL